MSPRKPAPNPVSAEFMHLNPACIPAHDAWEAGQFDVAASLMAGMGATVNDLGDEYPCHVVSVTPYAIVVRMENSGQRKTYKPLAGAWCLSGRTGKTLTVGVARRDVSTLF